MKLLSEMTSFIISMMTRRSNDNSMRIHISAPMCERKYKFTLKCDITPNFKYISTSAYALSLVLSKTRSPRISSITSSHVYIQIESVTHRLITIPDGHDPNKKSIMITAKGFHQHQKA